VEKRTQQHTVFVLVVGRLDGAFLDRAEVALDLGRADQRVRLALAAVPLAALEGKNAIAG
jgi:hypothetical protein